VAALEPVSVHTQVLGADEKRLHLFHTLVHGRTGENLATGEHLLLHVDTSEGRSVPSREPLASLVAAAAAAHASLPAPEGAGHAIALRRS
ncbi:MAG TPA: thioesterase family protein, partial [Gaiellaceae bacterium]|nr:thioesterase family protein [Gaiellaceae bacterium]